MSVAVKKDSWLRFSNLVTIDGIEFWDLTVLADIPTQADDLRHTVTSADRLDLLAQTFYGSPVLKWVIMLANGIELEPTGLNEGTVLRIPSPSYVQQRLFSQSQQMGRRPKTL